jgi:undecaprenyl-diphosphatase
VDLSIQALVMGLVQGLTEFLPVSSSGHLVLVPWLFGWKDPFIDSVAFTVVLHMGTLVALLAFF